MGKLIIDGTAVYEIDEACVRQRKIPKECDVLDKLDPEWKNKSPKRNKAGRGSYQEENR